MSENGSDDDDDDDRGMKRTAGERGQTLKVAAESEKESLKC